MKKYLMVIANYSDARQEFFNLYMSPRNKEYCKIHNTVYLEYTTSIVPIRGSYTWLKFELVRNLITSGILKEGDVLTHIDADMCIVKPEIEYPCNKTFSYAIDSGNTHCMGNYSIKINDWSKQLLDNILDDLRFRALNDILTIHEAFGTLSSFWHEFREQASWYSLAGIKRHSWEPFWNLSNFGWHSSKDTFTLYSLEDLYNNVEILPTIWNVTELEGESNCQFNINKTNKEDVIIRHFAGGQPWRKEWFEL
jgi:hypothetical protein